MTKKPKVGQRVRVVSHGAGTVSGKHGVVFTPQTDGRGIPKIPGDYKPMGRDDVAVQFDDGDAIVLDKRYLELETINEGYYGLYRPNPHTREIGRHVYDYASAAKFLGNKSKRKLANNTTIFYSALKTIAVRLHRTVIVRYFEDGTIVLDSGGYRTRTTLQRINQLLPPGVSVYQKRYDWFVDYHGYKGIPFRDGMEIGEMSLENPPRHNPGKFSSPLDEYVYQLSLDGGNEEIGDVEGFGHYLRMDNVEFLDVVRAAEDAGEDEHSARKAWEREFKGTQLRFKGTIPSVIIQTDNQGFVSVGYYADSHRADGRWEELQEEYDEFMEGTDSDED